MVSAGDRVGGDLSERGGAGDVGDLDVGSHSAFGSGYDDDVVVAWRRNEV